uniref:Uncharacterized protein n=1 Tax=Plectus sambesii TaxID=2011161 RepID=A0A914WYM7_9BILA
MRAQKKILGKMSSRSIAKHFISDTAARLLDNLYRILKDFYTKKEAEKVVKNVIKMAIKMGVLAKNEQFNEDQRRALSDFQRKYRQLCLTIVSFAQDINQDKNDENKFDKEVHESASYQLAQQGPNQSPTLHKNDGNAFDNAAHHQSAPDQRAQPVPNQFPTSRKDPPVTRSCRTRGSKGSSNEEQCKIPEEQSNEEDKENAGSQVATDTKTKATEDVNECYFKHERLNPDGLEKNERPDRSKVSTECERELRSFEELANSEPVPNLFGAENNADLALIRGAAEFGNDFDDEAGLQASSSPYLGILSKAQYDLLTVRQKPLDHLEITQDIKHL